MRRYRVDSRTFFSLVLGALRSASRSLRQEDAFVEMNARSAPSGLSHPPSEFANTLGTFGPRPAFAICNG